MPKAGTRLVELDLWQSRSRRQSESRRARALRRLRSRRRLSRVGLVAVAAAAVALAAVAGPRGASSVARLVHPPAKAPRCPMPNDLRPAFALAARETGVSLGLLAAVARVESQFDQRARSHSGAVGVLQLMPRTAASLSYDPHELRSNVMAGALYLRQMLDRYGSLPLALAAYNAGPTAVDRAGGSPSAETAAYVSRVVGAYRGSRGCA